MTVTNMTTEIQKEALKKPCPHCELGRLHEVEANDLSADPVILWCNNCDLSMDGDGGIII